MVFVLIMMKGLCSDCTDTGDFVISIAHVLHAMWIACVSSWYSNQFLTVQSKSVFTQPAVQEKTINYNVWF
jgi:hypothetical protein